MHRRLWPWCVRLPRPRANHAWYLTRQGPYSTGQFWTVWKSRCAASARTHRLHGGRQRPALARTSRRCWPANINAELRADRCSRRPATDNVPDGRPTADGRSAPCRPALSITTGRLAPVTVNAGGVQVIRPFRPPGRGDRLIARVAHTQTNEIWPRCGASRMSDGVTTQVLSYKVLARRHARVRSRAGLLSSHGGQRVFEPPAPCL
jgi:hypothetical protein